MKLTLPVLPPNKPQPRPKPWKSTKTYFSFHWDASIPLKWKLIKGQHYFKHVSETSAFDTPTRERPIKPKQLTQSQPTQPILSTTPSHPLLKNYFRSSKKIRSFEKLKKIDKVPEPLPNMYSAEYAITKYSIPNPLVPTYKFEELESPQKNMKIQEFMERFKKKHSTIPDVEQKKGLKGGVLKRVPKPKRVKHSVTSEFELCI